MIFIQVVSRYIYTGSNLTIINPWQLVLATQMNVSFLLFYFLKIVKNKPKSFLFIFYTSNIKKHSVALITLPPYILCLNAIECFFFIVLLSPSCQKRGETFVYIYFLCVFVVTFTHL